MTTYLTLDDVRCLTCESKAALHREYARRYDLDVFVETGTNEGYSSKRALEWARRVLTTESCREYYDRFGAQFAGDPRVLRAWADSPAWLGGVAAEGPGRALIWLDTHNDETLSTTAELLVLCAHRENLRSCVVLIDDARWRGQPDLEEVRAAFGDTHDVTLKDDIIRAVPR